MTTTQINVSENTRNIMVALLAGDLTSKEVAEQLNVKTVVVTGSMATMKKHGLVDMVDGKMHLLEAGRVMVAPVVEEPAPTVGVTVVATSIVKKGDKKARAAAIVASMPEGSSRKDIMARFMSELGMSSAMASTYHYNMCGDKGTWKA